MFRSIIDFFSGKTYKDAVGNYNCHEKTIVSHYTRKPNINEQLQYAKNKICRDIKYNGWKPTVKNYIDHDTVSFVWNNDLHLVVHVCYVSKYITITEISERHNYIDTLHYTLRNYNRAAELASSFIKYYSK